MVLQAASYCRQTVTMTHAAKGESAATAAAKKQGLAGSHDMKQHEGMHCTRPPDCLQHLTSASGSKAATFKRRGPKGGAAWGTHAAASLFTTVHERRDELDEEAYLMAASMSSGVNTVA